MALIWHTGFRVDQALFGYDDGHRLLGTSVRLSPKDQEKLLLLSDLAPGVSVLRSDGYWTGAPLEEASAYALMRTWPAPEMPRPGCVWTHVLLIKLEDLDKLWDLNGFPSYFVRPGPDTHGIFYSEQLVVSNSRSNRTSADDYPSYEIGKNLLEAAYLGRRATGPEITQAELIRTVLSLWSQQWPKLRAGFSFRTAGDGSRPRLSTLRFDLHVSGNNSYSDVAANGLLSVNVDEIWLEEATKDLFDIQPSMFRQFLRHYGADMSDGKRGFRALSLTYVSLKSQLRSRGKAGDFLRLIAEQLPSVKDGGSLKRDIIGFTAVPALLPPESFLDVATFLLLDERASSFPSIEPQACDVLKNLWNTQRQAVLDLAELAATISDENAEIILGALVHLISPSSLMEATEGLPQLRRRLVKLRPSLLDWSALYELPADELVGLLKLVSPKSDSASAIVARALPTSSVEVARYVMEAFRDQAVKHIIANRGHAWDGRALNSFWLQLAADQALDLLKTGFTHQLASTSSLAYFANMLGFINESTLEIGPLPWIEPTQVAVDDVEGFDKQCFSTFLLSLSLAKPSQGVEYLLQYSFETVHNDLWNSTLPHRASVMLEGQLPQVSWWKQWDTCFRLRTAVVRTYIGAHLSPSSFKHLSRNSQLIGQLMEQVDDDPQGGQFRIEVLRSYEVKQ